MAVLQMQRISICALKSDRKAILEELQSLGVMEINNTGIRKKGMKQMDTMESRQVFEKRATQAENALAVLHTYAPEKSSLFSSLAGKPLIDKSDYDSVVARQDALMDSAEQIVRLDKEISESNSSVLKLQNQIESLGPWMSLDIPMDFEGTSSTAVLTGTIPSEMTMEAIRTGVAGTAPDLEAYDVNVVSASQDMTCLSVLCLKKDAGKLEEALRALGFARPAQTLSKIPSEQKTDLEAQIKKQQEKAAASEDQIKEYAKDREDLKMVADYYRVRSDKYQALGELYQSPRTFVISGYVCEKDVPALTQRLESEYVCQIDVDKLKKKEVPPIALKNGKIPGCMEGVLASFGLPGKREFDPSTLMSIFYIILFGMMLSDAAYGLICFVGCFVILRKFPRMSDSMTRYMRLFMYCGISTIFWGVMFGGFFGNAVTVVAETFFGMKNVAFPTVWFAPLDHPMRLLIYCMLFGMIHLYVGLGAKGYMCLRDKKYLKFFCDVVLWYLLLTGLILILLPTSLFESISQMKFSFPAPINTLAIVMAVVGGVGILVMSGRRKKNVGLRLALGLYDLYNITGWLSDVLSYSRLLALGLATGVIANVVNQMGSMFGGGVLGAILFIVIFLIGHGFNMAINMLGAYVHSCRLEYVEFFGKFYEGGGRAFAPFKENTKYVDIKEEA